MCWFWDVWFFPAQHVNVRTGKFYTPLFGLVVKDRKTLPAGVSVSPPESFLIKKKKSAGFCIKIWYFTKAKLSTGIHPTVPIILSSAKYIASYLLLNLVATWIEIINWLI